MKSVEVAEEIGFSWWDANTSESVGMKLLELGRLDEAATWLRRSLDGYLEIGDRLSVIGSLTLLARIALRRENPDLAGRLWGAVERAEERLASPLWDEAREHYAGPLLATEDDAFERARAAGRSLTLEEAVAAVHGDR
jgi:hypothetical protein